MKREIKLHFEDIFFTFSVSSFVKNEKRTDTTTFIFTKLMHMEQSS